MKRFYLMIAILLAANFVSVSKVRARETTLIRPLGFEMEKDGSILVADGGDWNDQGGKVILFSDKGDVLWVYEKDLKFPHSAIQLRNGNVLITDTGNDRLVEVNGQKIVWTSEGKLELDYPNKVVELTNSNWLLTDRNNDRVVEIDSDKNIIHEWNGLNRPHGATQLANGNVLVCDSENNKVVELTTDKKPSDSAGRVVWKFGDGLNWPRSVQKLENGNYLISDSRNNRVIEVSADKKPSDSAGRVVWEFADTYWPYQAERLNNGQTLISDSQNRRLIWVSEDKKITKEIWLGHPTPPTTEWLMGVQLAENQGRWSESSRKLTAENYGRGEAFWYKRLTAPKGGETWRFSTEVETELTGDKNHGARLEIWVESEKGGYVTQPVVSKWLGEKQGEKLVVEVKIPVDAKAVELRGLINGKGKMTMENMKWQKTSWWSGWGVWTALGIVASIIVRWLVGRFL